MSYPWKEGDALLAVDLNAAIANAGGGSFLPVSGGTADHVNATTGLFSGIATLDMRQGHVGGVEHRTWVGLSDNGYMTYYDTQSQLAVIPPSAFALGIAASVRSSDRLSGPATASIGVAAFNKSDSGDPNAGITWAFYGSTRKYPNTTTALGMELSVGCVGQGATDVNPYQTGGNNSAVGLWLSSGSEAFDAGEDVHPASSAITVVSNGSTWDKGLVFGVNALTPAPVTGNMKAVQLPAKGEIQWTYNNAFNARSSFIRCDATVANTVGVLFTNNGFNITDSGETVNIFQLTVGAPASGATSMLLRVNNNAGVTTVPVSLGAPDSGGAGYRALRVPN